MRSLAFASLIYHLDVSWTAQDLTIKLWDMLHGQEIKTMTGHTQPITSLSFSAESSTLVSGGLDCTVRVWDVKTSGGLKKAATHGASSLLSGDEVQERQVTDAFFNVQKGLIISCFSASVDLLTTYRTKRTPITTTHFTPRNLCLVAGTYQED